MQIPRVLSWLAPLILVAACGGAAFITREQWLPAVQARFASPSEPDGRPEEHDDDLAHQPETVELSPQARKNLNLVSRPVWPQTYWRTVVIPGEVIDRPGVSDRGVTSPAVGAVIQVHAFPGDTVRAGQPLFTLRLFSEYLQNTQSELFSAARETELIQEELTRLQELSTRGSVSEAKVIELNNQLRRQNALILSYRQDLLTRGLTPDQLALVEQGQFVSTIEVAAPPLIERGENSPTAAVPVLPVAFAGDELAYEVQKLSVELGQQVQAGQLLAELSNHQSLYVEGHAFKQEAPFLEQAAQEGRPITVEFPEDGDAGWPALEQTFEIRHLANTIDADSRTFDFFIPLQNQSRRYSRLGATFLVWRFRPGQRARLHVPVEKFENVYVLPTAAVVRDGPEAYVFRQGGPRFDRRAVHVLYEDPRFAVIENDGVVTPGTYLAQSAAASLNRVLQAQATSGEPAGVHVDPDGSVHGPH